VRTGGGWTRANTGDTGARHKYGGRPQLPNLLNDTLILSKRLQFDVFNALDVLESYSFLKAR